MDSRLRGNDGQMGSSLKGTCGATQPSRLHPEQGPHRSSIVDGCILFCPFRATIGCFAVPRAAFRDVPSLHSARGYNVAAPFGAKYVATHEEYPEGSRESSHYNGGVGRLDRLIK
jgi:hypothetical protein